jgi:hypothetical protein
MVVLALFTPEKRTIKKYDREYVKVNDEHIEKIMRHITERDIEILQLLLNRPYLTTTQIEMMVFSNLKPSSWRNKANERLRKLYHAHCIDRWYPPTEKDAGSSESHYVLDRAGALFLAKRLGYSKGEYKWRKRNYIAQNYKHTLKIFDFEALLKLLNRQIGVAQDGGTLGEMLQWRTEYNARIKYTYREDGKKPMKGELIPDAFCIYNAHSRVKLFFLEIDNATMDLEQLKMKIRRYVECYKSRAWKETEWGRRIPDNVFPAVCVVMHDDKSITELRKYIVSLRSNIRFLFSTYDKLVTCEYKDYMNNGGKTRRVLQEIKVNLLEDIWRTNKEEGLVAL